MDDKNDFERQLASTMQQAGRPSRPVDAAAIVRSASGARPVSRWSTVTRRLRGDAPSAPTERGFSMFSAVKLIAAAAVVALFGGFLMSGVLTTQDGNLAPAAITESPAPITTDELIAGFVTEEVEPGVLLVTNDGYRDLSHPGRDWGVEGGVAVGGDGHVWLLDAFGEFFSLGEEAEYDLADEFLMDYDEDADLDYAVFVEPNSELLQAGPDGRLWMLSGRDIMSFDPETANWDPLNPGIRAADIAVDDVGRVWATLTDELVRFDADGTATRYALPEGYRQIVSLMVSPDGVAHVMAMPSLARDADLETTDILRLDDGALVTVVTAGPPQLWPPTAGLGGTLWAGPGYEWPDDFPHPALMRLDETGWTTFTEADGIRLWGGKFGWYPGEMITAAPDGSVWVDATADDGECDGLGRFDGETWTSYLSGHCIADIDFTADGAAWVLAEGPYLDHLSTNVRQAGVFLIRP